MYVLVYRGIKKTPRGESKPAIATKYLKYSNLRQIDQKTITIIS